MVSGSLSLPSPGFFSPFPHGTSALSVALTYLALDRGRPSFRQDFSCPVVLKDSAHADRSVSCTGLSPSLVSLPSRLPLQNGFFKPRGPLCTGPGKPLQPLQRNATQLTRHRFRLLPVRSPLLRESRVDVFSSRYLDGSVPWVSLPCTMDSCMTDGHRRPPGYPIRPFADLGMFAPPRNFSQLTTAFIARELLGILHGPFLA